MTLYWYDHVESVLKIAASAALCLPFRKREARKRWPWMASLSFFLLPYFLTCNSFQLYLSQFPRLATHKTAYLIWFSSYWTGMSVQALLSLGALYEAVMSLPLATSVPKNLKISFSVAAVILTLGCAYSALLASPNTFFWTSLALKLQLGIAASWCGFGIAVVYSVGFVGLRWTVMALRITTGFLVQSVLGLGAFYFSTKHPELGRNLTFIYSLANTAVMAYWSFALMKPSTASLQHPEGLQQILTSLGLALRTPNNEEA